MAECYFDAVGRLGDTAVIDFLAASDLRASEVSLPVTGRGRGDEPGSFRVQVSGAGTGHEQTQRDAIAFLTGNRAELARLSGVPGVQFHLTLVSRKPGGVQTWGVGIVPELSRLAGELGVHLIVSCDPRSPDA